MVQNLSALFVVVLIVSIAQVQPALGQEPLDWDQGEPSRGGIESEEWGFWKRTEWYLINKNIAVSEKMTSFGQWLDMSLAGAKYSERENNSRLTIVNFFSYKETEGLRSSSNFDWDIHLPHLERKFELKFASYDEEEAERGVVREVQKEAPPENLGLSLGFLGKSKNVRTSFRPRIELSDPLKTSFVLRFKKTHYFGQYVKFKPRLDLFAHSEDGTGQFLSLNFEFFLSGRFLLRIINEEEYKDLENLMTTTHGLSLIHDLYYLRTLTYSMILQGESQPAYHLANYFFAVQFKHEVYPNIFHYYITPRLEFDEDSGFKGAPVMTTTLELVF